MIIYNAEIGFRCKIYNDQIEKSYLIRFSYYKSIKDLDCSKCFLISQSKKYAKAAINLYLIYVSKKCPEATRIWARSMI